MGYKFLESEDEMFDKWITRLDSDARKCMKRFRTEAGFVHGMRLEGWLVGDEEALLNAYFRKGLRGV